MTRLLLAFIFILFSITKSASQPNPTNRIADLNPKWLPFFNKFSLHIGTGFGIIFFNHKINGPNIMEKEDGRIFLFEGVNKGNDFLESGYSDWVNNAQVFSNIPIDDKDFFMDTKIKSVKYKGVAKSLPFLLTLSYRIGNIRFGGGFFYEQSFAIQFLSTTAKSFTPNYSKSSVTKYYGYIGANIFTSSNYRIIADAMIGEYKFNKKIFNAAQINTTLYLNLGLSFERSISEYFEIFIRPSAEIKGYDLTIPELDYTVSHSDPALYVSIGAIIRIPDFKKCRVTLCKTQINHRHEKRIYRSNAHPFWKRQNPNYGQNYPTLIKYKKENQY